MEDVVEQMRKDIKVEIVKGDAFRVSYSRPGPAHGDEGGRPAGRLDHRREPERPDGAGRSTPPTSCPRSSRTPAPPRGATRRSWPSTRRRTPASCRPSARRNLQVLSNTQMQLQALIESMNQDRDRRYLIEKAIAELSESRQAAPNVTVSGDDPTAVAGGTHGRTARGGPRAAAAPRAALQAGPPGCRPDEAHHPGPRGEGAGRGAPAAALGRGRAEARHARGGAAAWRA